MGYIALPLVIKEAEHADALVALIVDMKKLGWTYQGAIPSALVMLDHSKDFRVASYIVTFYREGSDESSAEAIARLHALRETNPS